MARLPKLDTKAAEEGRWVTYYEDIRVLIARSGNRAARDMTMKLGQRSSRIRAGSQSATDDALKKVAAHCLIRGWEGMVDDDGREIPFSPEKALELFKDPQYAPFYEFVLVEANDHEAYLASAVEDAVGN